MSQEPNFALLSMDFQNAMVELDGRIGAAGLAAEVARRGTVDVVATALETFRTKGWPVIHVRVAFDPGYTRMTSASPRFASFQANQMMIETSEEAQITPRLAPIEGEPVVDKGCVIPFIGTRLPELLTKRGIRHLVLAGIMTNQVVEGTARVGADSGFQISVIEDGCASITQEMHEFSATKMLPNYGAVGPFTEIVAKLG